MSKVVNVSISSKTVWQVALVFVAFWAIAKLKYLIFYLLFAALFAVALSPMISWLESKGLRRGSALALALIVVVGVVFTLVGLVVASLVDTVVSFSDDLPLYIESLRQYDFIGDETIDNAKEAVANVNFQDVVARGITQGASILSGVSRIVEATLFTFFFTVYMLLERDYIVRIIRRVIPKNWKPRFKDLEREFVEVVGGYIRGQLLTSFLVGLSSYAFFRFYNVPNALALAIIAGMFDIIPVIGGLIGIIPAALVSLTVSPWTAIIVVLLMQTYSTLSNYLIRPKIFGHSLDLSPFLVTVATTMGLMLFGIPGILLALPTAAMVGYILTKYYHVPIIEESK